MTRPTLAEHATRLALVEQAAQQAKSNQAERDELMLRTLNEVRDEVKSLRAYVEREVEELRDRQLNIESRVDKVLGNVRAFGAGMAAAFMAVGAAVGAGFSQVLEWFK